MTVPTAVLTPFTRSAARNVGGQKWLKRVLPVGSISYEGREITFDQEYLADLANAFRSRAYDYVPFQLAPADNKHTNDVERYGGRIDDMRLDLEGPDGPGLYVVLNATERGQKVIKDNPQLGVSARIVEDYARADGKHFGRAVQHVLATHDPRITGLGGWRAVEAANDGIVVTIDLSGARFAGETEGTGDMPELTAEQQARLAKLLEIPEDAWQQVVAGLTAPSLTPEELAALSDGNGQDASSELSDTELEELLAAAQELDAAGLLGPERETAGASLSGDPDMLLALELTNARADQTALELSSVTRHLDNERYEAEKRRLADDFNIPPFITELAKPLLHGSGHAIELASGQAIDAGKIMRDVLTAVGKLSAAMGYPLIDLSQETGSPFDGGGTEATAAETARADVIARAKATMGL